MKRWDVFRGGKWVGGVPAFDYSEAVLEAQRIYDLDGAAGLDLRLAAPARAISISEPLCKAYANLFSEDFSEDEIRKNTADSPEAECANFEPILRRFIDGLANSRLELVGTTDDLAGWLTAYLEAYVEPGDGEVDVPFSNWGSLTLAEQQEVKADSVRLTPVLRRPWPDIWSE